MDTRTESEPALDRRQAADRPGAPVRPPEPERVGPRLSFRTRLTISLIAAAVLPVAGLGIVLLLTNLTPENTGDPILGGRLVLFAVTVGVVFAILLAYILAADLTGPLRTIARVVDRVSAGDLSTRISVSGDDDFARLAESHNRLAADLERRNIELGRILAAIERASPEAGVDRLANVAGLDARDAFEMIDATVLLVDPSQIPTEDQVPGEARHVRAELRIGDERLGVLIGRLPATRHWEAADQDLLELYASEVAVAIRNAELFGRVERQNLRLLELDAAKDEFLRGVSHNLQTPLTSIRAYAGQLDADRPDRRLEIISEQADRLSRMVRQLLTVSRLESGALRPTADVVSLGSRVRRAWEALGAADVAFELDDRSSGWLAIADADQVDQVLWALLDNAVTYGGRSRIEVDIVVHEPTSRLRLTVTDHGSGVAAEDRPAMFGRFARGSRDEAAEGSGLGLYVSRELCRAMGGDLVLEPGRPDAGAAFSVYLPAEPPTES
jgi:two-component system sensor histidine kinase VicK